MKPAPFRFALLYLSAVIAQTAFAAAAPAPPTPDYSDYVLTPKPPHTPRINGPGIYGERPGNPFLYLIPATGDRPMTFAATGLPAGLRLDPNTGLIRGRAATPGTYQVQLTAVNALGTGTRDFRIVIGDQIALTPPMGWNSWNSWAGNVDQDKVLRSARMIVSSGLINHGWTYVNIDDTWQGARTGLDRALQANDKFPDMRQLCMQIHQMGLKAGIYSTPWITSYAGFPGGSGEDADGTWNKAVQGVGNAYHRIGDVHFVAADVKQWTTWGFDYLKYDWNIDQKNTKEMADALRASGRDIVLSLSNTAPFNDPQRGSATDWKTLANAWRTTGDINDMWGLTPDYHHGMAEIGFAQDRWAPFASPGHWNDPDMLVVGYVSVGGPIHSTHLSADEQYTHISLWCLLSAPLLIGCDMDRLNDFTLSLLTNDEVLALDQDALGKQAVQVSGPVFQPPPANGRRGGPPQPPPAVSDKEQLAVSDALRRILSEADPDAKQALEAHPNFHPLANGLPVNNPGGNGLVFAKPLEDGTLAVGLFNVGLKDETVSVQWSDLGLDGRRLVRDLWRQKDIGVFDQSFTTTVPSHGVVLVKLKPAP